MLNYEKDDWEVNYLGYRKKFEGNQMWESFVQKNNRYLIEWNVYGYSVIVSYCLVSS